MNLHLAEVAEAAVMTGRFETRAGYCLRFCREVDEALEGTQYERLFRGDGTARDATAARAGHRFLARGLGFLRSELAERGGVQPGDMLVKTQVARNWWGDYSGHIGVVCRDGKRVAENSSTTRGRVRGALGFRTLAQYGEFEIVVRLPVAGTHRISEKPGASASSSVGKTEKLAQAVTSSSAVFSYNHEVMPFAYFHQGRVVVPLVDFLQAFGYETHAEAVSAEGGNIQAWKAEK